MFKQSRLVIALLIMMASVPSFASTQQQKLDDIVSMLESNPELIETLHQNLSAYIGQQKQFEQVLADSQSYLNDPKQIFIGSETPEFTLFNVTDYSCPYCKKLDGELQKLVEAYPQIKVVNVYVPLKERASELNSASFALNVWQHDKAKYQQVHDLLVKKPGSHNPMSLAMVAKETDTESYLKIDDQINQQLDKNYKLFEEFGLRGTPALIIGHDVIPGYVPYAQLEEVIKDKLAK